MLNYVWFGMIAMSFIVGALKGNIEAVTTAAIDSAKLAVDLSIGLIGIMALWLGIMKIAEVAGLIDAIARIVRPITLWLFPDVPPDHPAVSAMVLNISANK
jgi:spore maturation protein A